MGMFMIVTYASNQSAVPRSSTPFSRIHSAKFLNSPPILYVTYTLSPYTSRRRCRIGSRPHDHQHHGSAKWTISIGTSSLDTLSPAPASEGLDLSLPGRRRDDSVAVRITRIAAHFLNTSIGALTIGRPTRSEERRVGKG